MTDNTCAYKILTADQWAAFQRAGEFAGAPIDLADGYIHLSSAEQLAGTLAKHFADADERIPAGLVVAEIDLAMLGANIRWEKSRGDVLFPHLYDMPLPMAAVVSVKPAA